MRYADLSDLPFCPGCTHEVIFRAMAGAFERGALDPKEIVAVSDIGCHGIADRALNVHTFHGLHGRSITYACGIKMAKPSLRVLVLIGDGGCGIGGTHLINAARRNVGICVLVFNNFNFGMTGGQHSVTTPCGARTSTTPNGNAERGLDLCRLAEASGATFIARVTAFDSDLPNVMAEGLAHEGFALIDVWGICTAHYMKRNEVRKAQLIEAARAMPGYGILRREVLPACSRPPVSVSAGLEDLVVPVEFRSSLDRRLEIVLAGSAGMRVRTAATLLARAAIRSGLYAAQKDTFPVTVMKGFSVSELILSPERIENLQVSAPDCLVIASEDGRKKTDSIRSRRVLDFASFPADGIRKTELALAMGATALRDVLTEPALRKTVELDGHADDRAKLSEAVARGLALGV